MSGATLVRVHGSWKRRAMFTSPALRERSARTARRVRVTRLRSPRTSTSRPGGIVGISLHEWPCHFPRF
jgi:hypothetical protein